MKQLDYDKVINDIDNLTDFSYELEKKLKSMIGYLEILIHSPSIDEEENLPKSEQLETENQKKWEYFTKYSIEIFSELRESLISNSSTLFQMIKGINSVYALFDEVTEYYEEIKLNHLKYLNPKFCVLIEKQGYEISESITDFKPCYIRLNEYSQMMKNGKINRLF